MSYFNFSHDLFLEVAELRRFSKFIIDDGIKQSLKMETSEFGIIKNPDDLQFENFRVINGALQKTITVKSGVALDKNFNFINYEGITNLSVPNDGDWYWIKIKHIFSPIETGTVNISANGTMTGTGTEFTKILRGQPNFPSVIRFENSANIYEYEVNEVISDTQCILAANFVAENNLKYLNDFGLVLSIGVPPFPNPPVRKKLPLSKRIFLKIRKDLTQKERDSIYLEEISKSSKNNNEVYYWAGKFGYVGYVTAYAKRIKDAQKKVLNLMNSISIAKKIYRTDIGTRVQKNDIPKLKAWGWL